MGYMMGLAPCIRCRQTFSFNVDLVPSIRVHGEREPLCRGCVDALNALRVQRGLLPIEPLPGAYEPQEVP